MLLRRRTVVVIGHVGGGNDEMTVCPRKAMRAHVILILLKNYSPARNEETRIVGTYASRLGLPNIDVANLKFGLHVTFQEVVNSTAEDAGSAGEERIHCMRNRENRVGTEHIIVIHGGETITNVVNDYLDGAREEGMAGSGRDEAVPQAAAVSDLVAGLCEMCKNQDYLLAVGSIEANL